MSALAKLCLHNGKMVSGSDRTKTELSNELEHLGAIVTYKHAKKNIEGADLVVYTSAVGENNVEILEAKRRGIKVLERADFLGEIAKEYREVIAVAGSHGKTTVCGMLQSIFEEAKKNPTVLIGGEASNGNLTIGKDDFLIVEACEYMEHFLKIGHSTAVILNIDYDHPDYFKTQRQYELAFEKFAKMSKKQVFLNEKYSIFIENSAITFGNGGDYQARHVTFKEDKILFDVYKKNRFFEKIKLNIIGSYNVLNALATIAVTDYYKIEKACIKRGLEQFASIKRRFEYMGKLGSNIVITDYAHHPTQIKNCVEAARTVYKKKITVVYEPHTYSRTKAFLSDFANSLSLADNIIILPTYSAREKSMRGGASRDLFETLSHTKSSVSFVKSYKKCQRELEKIDDNIILILGAGSIIKLAQNIKKQYLLNSDKNFYKSLD